MIHAHYVPVVTHGYPYPGSVSNFFTVVNFKKRSIARKEEQKDRRMPLACQGLAQTHFTKTLREQFTQSGN